MSNAVAHQIVEFPELAEADAPALAALLACQRTEYLQHFHPFPFDAAQFVALVRNRRKDGYWAIRWNGELAGFVMLRGWDEGFERPAFGVFIAEQFAGRGLASRALDFAVERSRAAAAPALILTVHPDNARARDLYLRAGFLRAGTNPKTQHHLYEKLLNDNPERR